MSEHDSTNLALFEAARAAWEGLQGLFPSLFAQHKQSGHVYRIVSVAIDEATLSPTVLYVRSTLVGVLPIRAFQWARPMDSFVSKFTPYNLGPEETINGTP